MRIIYDLYENIKTSRFIFILINEVRKSITNFIIANVALSSIAFMKNIERLIGYSFFQINIING